MPTLGSSCLFLNKVRSGTAQSKKRTWTLATQGSAALLQAPQIPFTPGTQHPGGRGLPFKGTAVAFPSGHLLKAPFRFSLS